jgi:hypothetical protein
VAGPFIKVLSFNIGTGAAGTTVTVTPGFPTKAAILFWSGATTNSAYASGHNLRGMGFLTSATDFRVVTTYDQDAAGTAITSCGHRTDSCIAEIGAADTFVGWADVQSISSTQVVFEILDQFVTDLYVTGIFIGGDDVAAESGVFTGTGVAPTTQVISTGITEASVTFLLGGPHTADAPTVQVDSTLSFGFGVGASASVLQPCAVLYGGANDGATSGSTGSYALGGEIYAMHATIPAIAPPNRAEYWGATVGGTGFTINWLARNAAIRVHYLTISGLSAKVVEILTQTDTTTGIPATGLPSTALGGMVISAGKTETVGGAAPAAQEEWSVGAFTSTTERAVQIAGSRNGNTIMFCQNGAYTTACYVNGNPDGPDTLEGLMDVQSIDSGGATFVMDDADPAQAWAGVLLLGAPVVATTSLPIFRRPQLYPRRKVA